MMPSHMNFTEKKRSHDSKKKEKIPFDLSFFLFFNQIDILWKQKNTCSHETIEVNGNRSHCRYLRFQ